MRKYYLANGEKFPPGYMSTLFAKIAALEKPDAVARVKMVWRFVDIWNMKMLI